MQGMGKIDTSAPASHSARLSLTQPCTQRRPPPLTPCQSWACAQTKHPPQNPGVYVRRGYVGVRRASLHDQHAIRQHGRDVSGGMDSHQPTGTSKHSLTHTQPAYSTQNHSHKWLTAGENRSVWYRVNTTTAAYLFGPGCNSLIGTATKLDSVQPDELRGSARIPKRNTYVQDVHTRRVCACKSQLLLTTIILRSNRAHFDKHSPIGCSADPEARGSRLHFLT
jgi:hypothetical protein